MLTEICAYLKNYFDRDQPKFYCKFEVKDGVITSFNDGDMGIQSGQYFRISGSVFNDGVWKYDEDLKLTDEIFDGSVWLMAVPPTLIELESEIKDWMKKYGGIDSVNMSPFSSESFGGYSYSKSGGDASDGTSGAGGWQGVYGARLARWKKI